MDLNLGTIIKIYWQRDGCWRKQWKSAPWMRRFTPYIVEALISEYGIAEDDNDIQWAKREIEQLEQLLGEK